MSRIVLSLVAFALLSACDTGGPDASAALVGTWTLSDGALEQRITSATDQTLPGLTARATSGGIEIRGDAVATLRYVLDARATSPSYIRFRDAFALESVWLDLGVSITEPGEAMLQNPGGPIGVYTGEIASGTPLFTRDGATITIPEVALSGADGAAATARGSVTFPAVEYRAGEETAVRTREFDVFGLAIAFAEDGTFSREGSAGAAPLLPIEGTWSVDDAGMVTVRALAPSTAETAFTYAITDGALLLETFQEMDAAVAEIEERERLGEPGSFAGLRRGYVYIARR